MNRSSVKPGRLAFNALVSIFAYKIVNVLKLNACGVPLISLLVVKVLFATISAKPTIRFEFLFILINKLNTPFSSHPYMKTPPETFSAFPVERQGLHRGGRPAGGGGGAGGRGRRPAGRPGPPPGTPYPPQAPHPSVSWVRIGSVVVEVPAS